MPKKTSNPYLIFIIPALAILLAIIAFPFVFNLYISLTRWELRFRGPYPNLLELIITLRLYKIRDS